MQGMRMTARILAAVALVAIAGATSRAESVTSAADSTAVVSGGWPGVSPQLIAEAAEVWAILARPDNPVWPGWDASDTPLLLYLPGRQDLLINHPHPPEGFRPYLGVVRVPGARMVVRNGATLIGSDGQNTSSGIAGVRTLVVADPLSTLRQRVATLIEDQRPAGEKVRGLDFDGLLEDPYQEMATVAHEAFHVYQDRVAPNRSNEMLLLYYPVLSVENNVGFGLEASALAAAITAPDEHALRMAALRWLAVRLDRRRQLPARAIQYEDGTEFNEGLAKYVEYRLFQVLEGRTPGAMLAGMQGFHGFADLGPQRDGLVHEMVRNLRGEVNVNNDPYGTAPLRFRLYYSGMAIGVLLDRLAPRWHHDIMAADTSLTALLRDALRPTDTELVGALATAHADAGLAMLRAAKTRLAEDGRARIAGKLAALESGPGTRLVVDYSALGTPKVGLSFTPFGITVVDSVRTFFEQVPIRVTFPDGSALKESFALPVLRDTHRREISCRLAKMVTRADVERSLGRSMGTGATPRPVKLELPEVSLDLKRARVAWDAGTIRIALLPAATDSTH